MANKTVIVAMLTIVITTLLYGCSGDVVFPGGESEKEPEIITSNVISVPIEKIRTLNPLLSLDEDSYYLNKLVYEGLFALNERLEAVKELAGSYEHDKESGIISIRLLDNVLWQDGEMLTAQDVKFTIDAFKSVPSNKQGTYGRIINLIKSAKVTDSHTITIQFGDPDNASIENLTFPILPAHKYKKPSDLARVESNFLPVGTGPYWISNVESGKKITLSGNPNFRKGTPKNLIELKWIPDKDEAVNLFDIGEINIAFLRSIDRNTLVEDKVVKMVSFLSNEVEVLGFNFNHGALQNTDVRRAIAYSIDNRSILETCYYNSGVLNDSIYYPGYFGVETDEDLIEYDVIKGSSLLKSSGYEGLSLDLIFNGENKARNLAAQIVKLGLEKSGISVNLVSLPRDDYNARLLKGDFDLYIGGFKINDNYDLRPLLHTKGELNHISYSNEQMDALLDELQRCLSVKEKRAAFEGLNGLYRDEIPYYCLLYKTYGLAASTGMTGEIRPGFNNIFAGCEEWRVTYEKPITIESGQAGD